MAFGKRLKEILRKHGKTVTWLAQETGIPPTTLYSILARDSSPSMEIIFAVADALDIRFEELLEDDLELQNKVFRLMRDKRMDEASQLLGLPPGTIRAPEPEEEIEILKKMLQKEKQRVGLGGSILLEHYHQLNAEGKQEAIKRIKELTLLDMYMKKNSDET